MRTAQDPRALEVMAAKGQLSRKRPTCLNLLKNRVQPYKVLLQKPYKADEQLILICLQRHLFSAARKECAEKK